MSPLSEAPANKVPTEVTTGVAEALGEQGQDAPFVAAERLGGGCTHPTLRIRTRRGDQAFLKWAEVPGRAGFDVEARGLRSLARADGPKVPKVLAFSSGEPHSRGWLLLEFIEPGNSTPRTAERLGQELAQLHRPIGGAAPGWNEDGYIGPLPQMNGGEGLAWPDFWGQRRLWPQWERAEGNFDSQTRTAWNLLLENLETVLEGWEEEGLALLHGDLWSGNVITAMDGSPVLVDPAVYLGHREVDLAMMELFGGFDRGFFSAYEAEAPIVTGYRELRRDVYQLYPLLVHVNLFGGAYVGAVRQRVLRLARPL